MAATRSALQAGPAWIYQAALANGSWSGYADFLQRVPRPSKLGDFSYEVIDTKLKRTPEPKHVLQLVVYSDLLAQVQGIEPEHIHIVLGDRQRITLRLADYAVRRQVLCDSLRFSRREALARLRFQLRRLCSGAAIVVV